MNTIPSIITRCGIFLCLLSTLLAQDDLRQLKPAILLFQDDIGQITVSWDANTEIDLEGYKVYYGSSSGTYDFIHDVGLNTSHTIVGPEPGTSYFFAVTAYDTVANESGFSNEVVYPKPPLGTQPTNWSKDEHSVELLVNGNDIDWGSWNENHVYSITFSATNDSVLSFQIFDFFYGDNSGSLEVEVKSAGIDWSASVPATGETIQSPEIPGGTVVTITVSGTFNYWNTNAWANADAEYTQTSN